jgi:hypothetical protein
MVFGKVIEGIIPQHDTQALADAVRRRNSIQAPPPRPRAVFAPSTNVQTSVNSVNASPVPSFRPTAILIFDITTFRILFRIPSSPTGNRSPTTMSDSWSTQGWFSHSTTFAYPNGGHSRGISSVRGFLEPPDGPYESVRIHTQEQLQSLNPPRTSNQVLSEFLRHSLNTIKAKACLIGVECEYMFILPTHWSHREISAYNTAIVSAEITNKKLCPEMYVRAWYVARNPAWRFHKWCVLIIPQDGITIETHINNN